MSETTTEVAQETEVTVETFQDFLVRYAGVKSLLDLAVRHDDPREFLVSRIDAVCETIADARMIAKNGRGITLSANLGFGSSSAAEIAGAIAGNRENNASLKGKAGKAGKAILRTRTS